MYSLQHHDFRNHIYLINNWSNSFPLQNEVSVHDNSTGIYHTINQHLNISLFSITDTIAFHRLLHNRPMCTAGNGIAPFLEARRISSWTLHLSSHDPRMSLVIAQYSWHPLGPKQCLPEALVCLCDTTRLEHLQYVYSKSFVYQECACSISVCSFHSLLLLLIDCEAIIHVG